MLNHRLNNKFIHSFNIRNHLSFAGPGVGGSQLTLSEGGFTQPVQFITGLTYREKRPFALTFTPTGSLESPVNLHVFGL